jgi:four helix bundle protein
MQRSTSNFQRPTLNKGNTGSFDLEERLLRYAASIVRLMGKIPSDRSGNHIAAQLLRSGTSPLPNHGEAQAAESVADFVHKLHICLKELRESRRWLKLINEVSLIKEQTEVNRLIDETEQLIKIFVASVRTAQSNAAKSKVKQPSVQSL